MVLAEFAQYRIEETRQVEQVSRRFEPFVFLSSTQVCVMTELGIAPMLSDGEGFVPIQSLCLRDGTPAELLNQLQSHGGTKIEGGLVPWEPLKPIQKRVHHVPENKLKKLMPIEFSVRFGEIPIALSRFSIPYPTESTIFLDRAKYTYPGNRVSLDTESLTTAQSRFLLYKTMYYDLVAMSKRLGFSMVLYTENTAFLGDMDAAVYPNHIEDMKKDVLFTLPHMSRGSIQSVVGYTPI